MSNTEPRKKIIIIKKQDRKNPIIQVETAKSATDSNIPVINKEDLLRDLLIKYFEYIHEYQEEFQNYINEKLFGRQDKYIYFNKQKEDYYLNICSTDGKFGNFFCKNINKNDLIHVSFHIGDRRRPFQIHMKCAKSNWLIIDTKLAGDSYVFTVNQQSEMTVYHRIMREFSTYHKKTISAENIMNLVTGLFVDYQQNLTKSALGGGNCECLRCAEEGEYVTVDFDNIFFTQLFDTILDYMKVLIQIESSTPSTVQPITIPSSIPNKLVSHNNNQEKLKKTTSTGLSGGTIDYYKKYMKYKTKYLNQSKK